MNPYEEFMNIINDKYMFSKTVSDMSKDTRTIEEVLNDMGVKYLSINIIENPYTPGVRVIYYTNDKGQKRTVLAYFAGIGPEGQWVDNYDYFDGTLIMPREGWVMIATMDYINRIYK